MSLLERRARSISPTALAGLIAHVSDTLGDESGAILTPTRWSAAGATADADERHRHGCASARGEDIIQASELEVIAGGGWLSACCERLSTRQLRTSLGLERSALAEGVCALVVASAQGREALSASTGAKEERDLLSELVEITGMLGQFGAANPELGRVIQAEKAAAGELIRQRLRSRSRGVRQLMTAGGSDSVAWALAASAVGEPHQQVQMILRASTLTRTEAALSWLIGEELATHEGWILMRVEEDSAHHLRQQLSGRGPGPDRSSAILIGNKPAQKLEAGVAQLSLELVESHIAAERERGWSAHSGERIVAESLSAAQAAVRA